MNQVIEFLIAKKSSSNNLMSKLFIILSISIVLIGVLTGCLQYGGTPLSCATSSEHYSKEFLNIYCFKSTGVYQYMPFLLMIHSAIFSIHIFFKFSSNTTLYLCNLIQLLQQYMIIFQTFGKFFITFRDGHLFTTTYKCPLAAVGDIGKQFNFVAYCVQSNNNFFFNIYAFFSAAMALLMIILLILLSKELMNKWWPRKKVTAAMWSKVAGLEGAKKVLEESIIFPIKFPQLFSEQLKPWNSVLLYGPPGTGKTHLVREIAAQTKDSKFISVSPSDIASKCIGKSEKKFRKIFDLARENKPSIIFIDEIDALCGSRSDHEPDSNRRIKAEFLTQMDGFSNSIEGIFVIGETDAPWMLDKAILRRFERRIYIPLPDAKARYNMFKMNLSSTPNNLKEEDFRMLADKTEGFSGADINVLLRDSLMQPARNAQTDTYLKKEKNLYEPCSSDDSISIEMKPIQIEGKRLLDLTLTINDILLSVAFTKPTVSADDLIKFETFTQEFGQKG